MRTYGRVWNENGSYTWVTVSTDADGYNDYVYVTTLAQCLLLNRNESPFWANYGIPAYPSVAQQVFPDIYVALTQQQFAGYFASLIISKLDNPSPTYSVNVVTQQGVKMQATIAK